MKCLQCHTENRAGSRFCAECGAPLGVACPDCGFANDPNAKFCGGCGKTLSAPSESAHKGEAPEPERRQLTVMFCDLVGSTTLAERLDPEELHQLLAQYQDTCAEVIHRYDGYIARYVGDGLLVYFGYPHAHEDDAQRGVRAGLGIVEAIEQLNSKIERSNVNLAVRIGIATGLVVAGDIGSGERVEQNAIVGETPNLAARLQALAQRDAVVISGSTYRLVEGLFECDDLGAQRLKGISKPVGAYRVRGESGAPSRFEAKAALGLTPLVGREAEVDLLLKRWGQAKDGEGQVVLLSGEAGIGKSRITRGFQERLGAIRNRVLYYGSPYHQNSALYPIIDQLERALRFQRTDTTNEKLDKLEAVVTALDLPIEKHGPLLASLLSLSFNGRYPPLQLSAPELKNETLRTLVALVGRMSTHDTVLMVVEDAHWIDPSTLELISLFIEHLHAARFLLLITFRPEFESPWGRHPHLTALTLNRMSQRESLALVSNITRGKVLPNDVLDQIIARTDGVPLFIEELTKNVLESGLLEDQGDRYALSGPLPELAVPASLHDSLMARLDRLSQVKDLAQLAATLGRRFSHEVLAAVSPLGDKELEGALAKLIQAELLYRRGLPPEVVYEFKHALVQDAAYRSLLRSTRQQYHQRIAQVLEKQFPDTGETEPEILGHHYTEAGLADKAIGYWHRAGQLAAQRSANVEAVAHLTKGLDLIKAQPETLGQVRSELEFNVTLGPVLVALKGPAASEVEKTYLRARELCQQLGETSQLFTVTWGLWLSHQFRGQLKSARALADEVLALVEENEDRAFRLQAHHAAWTTLLHLPELALCRDHAEKGIALYDIDRHRSHAFLYGGHDPGVCARNNLAISLWFMGYPDQAREVSQAAITLAERLSYPFTTILSLYFSAWLHHCRREASLARERADAIIKLCTELRLAPQYRDAGAVMRGWSIAVNGQTKETIMEIENAIIRHRATGSVLRRPYLLSQLAEVYARAGRTNQGLDTLAEALGLIESIGENWWKAEVYRLQGSLLLAQSPRNQTEAEVCFDKALEVARRQKAKSLELRAATSLAQLWRDHGKRDEARDLLAPIYVWFTEGFDTADLKDAKTLLDELA